VRSLLIFLNYLRNYRLNRTLKGINSYTFLEEIYIIKLSDLRKCMTTTVVDIGTLIIRNPNLRGGRPIIAETGTSVRRIAVLYKQGNSAEEIARLMTHLSIAQVYAALTRSPALIYLRLSPSIGRHLRLKKDLYPLQS